jgi:uncharacterized protein
MPKKLLKRLIISNEKVAQNTALYYVSRSILQHNVWHLNRRSASRAAFIGLFFAFTPMPLQIIPAAFFCILARANLPITVALVWITNPATTPPILYACYKLGAFVLGIPPQDIDFQMDWEWLIKSLYLIGKPLLLGCAILSISTASIGYTVIDMAWRWSIIKRWQHRRKMRKLHS